MEEPISVDTQKESDVDPEQIDEVALLRRCKGWYKVDASARSKWRKIADEEFGFVANEQWEKNDAQDMEEKGRVPVVFNRTLTIIKSIAGSEINGRTETRFLPRELSDAKVNELLSAASDWMSDQCDAEDEQSEAFASALICGEGWTEARIDYDEDPEGKYIEEEVDAREIYPDNKACKANYTDARRVTRVRKISITEARAMFPGFSDTQLDASWAEHTGPDGKDPRPVEDKLHTHDDLDDPVAADRNDVTIVHMQWWEKQPYYLVAMEPDMTQPQMGQAEPKPEELSAEEYKVFKARAKEMGIKHQSAKMLKKVYKQAFIGDAILDHGPTPCPYGFSFNAITGERDRKNGTFYGLIRVMKDPQMWANKMLSNTLHIANTTAKGGIIAERDAFEDQRQAEESYAQPNEISWAKEGAVEKGKIMPKPGTGDPSAYFKLLEFAITSIRDVTGVNMELLGLRDVNQPGILEAQRKQAAMTVLAPVFNSLRRFRKAIGRIRLHFIQVHLSDGRLIRIKGNDGTAQTIPLLRDHTSGDYDVVIADAPTSPNMKEATWAMISQVLPVFKDMLTPDTVLMLLDYSPFPTDLVEKLREQKVKSDQIQAQQADKEAAQLAEDRQVVNQQGMAKAEKDKAAAEKARAEGAVAGAGQDVARMQGMAEARNTIIEGQANAQKAQAEAHAATAKAETQRDMDMATVQKIIAETQSTTVETMLAVMQQKLDAMMQQREQQHQEQMDMRSQQSQENDQMFQHNLAARSQQQSEQESQQGMVLERQKMGHEQQMAHREQGHEEQMAERSMGHEQQMATRQQTHAEGMAQKEHKLSENTQRETLKLKQKQAANQNKTKSTK